MAGYVTSKNSSNEYLCECPGCIGREPDDVIVGLRELETARSLVPEHKKKWERYYRLCMKDDASEEGLGKAESVECTQLYYELHPGDQYWLSDYDHRTPEQIWHVRRSKALRAVGIVLLLVVIGLCLLYMAWIMSL